jgi:hypothetical protein
MFNEARNSGIRMKHSKKIAFTDSYHDKHFQVQRSEFSNLLLYPFQMIFEQNPDETK